MKYKDIQIGQIFYDKVYGGYFKRLDDTNTAPVWIVKSNKYLTYGHGYKVYMFFDNECEVELINER